METVYLYALSANFCFALASQVFTHYSRKISAFWMNAYKALIALVCFAVAVLYLGGFRGVELTYGAAFFLSGALGLGLGDCFLLSAFREIGPGRTMLLFGFQPVIVGIMGFFFFGQTLNAEKFSAIAFFILCLVTISTESFRKDRNYQLKGISFAFLGMVFDALGVMLTRLSFDNNPGLGVMEGNFYRCIGAVAFFMIFGRFLKLEFLSRLKSFSPRSLLIVTFGSVMGTFVSLAFFLKAVQSAHLATLSGIAITGTIFSSLFECILERKWPSRYFLLSFVFFLLGMRIILF